MNTMQQIKGKPAAGDVLDNGARVLDSTITSSEVSVNGVDYYGFVLALNHKNEFVTWRLHVYPGGNVTSTNAGHYFDALGPAMGDYELRIAAGTTRGL